MRPLSIVVNFDSKYGICDFDSTNEAMTLPITKRRLETDIVI